MEMGVCLTRRVQDFHSKDEQHINDHSNSPSADCVAVCLCVAHFDKIKLGVT